MNANGSSATLGQVFGAAQSHDYKLTSDIAQFCLPAASKDSNRKYAYACSVFFAFLIIGLVGVLKAPQLVVREPPPVQELIPVEIVPVDYTPPPSQPQEVQDLDVRSDVPTDIPTVPVLVAAADANVPFAVPTEGFVAVTKLVQRAAAPPAVLVVQAPPTQMPKPDPAVFKRAQKPKGSFPEPAFPQGMLRNGQTVELWIRIDLNEDGSIAKIEADPGSGIYELDRYVIKHIEGRWKFTAEAAERSRAWRVPFQFSAR